MVRSATRRAQGHADPGARIIPVQRPSTVTVYFLAKLV
jgi:hypothetical protein